ncbi:hypothetical protein [Carboxylicivirga marina]|uniref:Uncharacterized protein n=1 Tax=Carboxylicivirga marina TaxID=2800988 RepID=A0ABS1HNW3_9BACT|nr:hypothetical protein [Carboxylicivirga marina]MBK3519290.1 hypothetical protein [Carboxylicivirga marina]
MRNNKKHIVDIDQMLRQTSVDNYEPSIDFVDKVMAQIDTQKQIKPQSKYIKLGFQLAAACALIIFITNVFVFLSSASTSENADNEWTSLYESNSPTNWYDYNNDDLFLANHQTTE